MSSDVDVDAKARAHAFTKQVGTDVAVRHLVDFFETMAKDRLYLRRLATFVELHYPEEVSKRVLPMARERLKARNKKRKEAKR